MWIQLAGPILFAHAYLAWRLAGGANQSGILTTSLAYAYAAVLAFAVTVGIVRIAQRKKLGGFETVALVFNVFWLILTVGASIA